MIGDVIVGSFAVDDGALFLGKCDMKDGRREPDAASSKRQQEF